MTDEEHQTRAMLLGMGWDKRMRLYYNHNKNFSHKNCIDHDTMEPIGENEWWDRFWGAKGIVELL